MEEFGRSEKSIFLACGSDGLNLNQAQLKVSRKKLKKGKPKAYFSRRLKRKSTISYGLVTRPKTILREKSQLYEPGKKKREASKYANLSVPSLFPHKIIPFPPLSLSLPMTFKSRSIYTFDSTQVYFGGSIMCCD